MVKKTKNNKTIYFIYTYCSLKNFQSGFLYNLPKIIRDTQHFMSMGIYFSVYNFDNFLSLTNVKQIKTNFASFNCFCPNLLLFLYIHFLFFLYL